MVFINFLALKGYHRLHCACSANSPSNCGLETYSLLYSIMIIIYNNILHPLYHHIIHDFLSIYKGISVHFSGSLTVCCNLTHAIVVIWI